MPIVVGTILIVIGGLPVLLNLQFDFYVMNLRNPNSESVAIYLELRKDPATGASAVDVLAPSLTAAREVAERLSKAPEVGSVRTLDTFIPQNQHAKLALIEQSAKALNPAIALKLQEPPSDQETTEALQRAATALVDIAGADETAGANAARRLAKALSELARGVGGWGRPHGRAHNDEI